MVDTLEIAEAIRNCTSVFHILEKKLVKSFLKVLNIYLDVIGKTRPGRFVLF